MKIVKPKDDLLTYLLSYLTNIGRKRLLVTRRISFFSFLEFLFIMPNKDIMSFNFYQTYATKLLMMKKKKTTKSSEQLQITTIQVMLEWLSPAQIYY